MSAYEVGWYPDPHNPGTSIYWDGQEWRVTPQGMTLTEKYAQQRRELIMGNARFVSFPRAVVLGFQHMVDFKSRSSRSEYWWWILFTALVANLPLRIASSQRSTFTQACLDSGAHLGHCEFGGPKSFLFYLGWIATIAFILPGTALAIRRLHDIGRTGWYVLALDVIPTFVLLLTTMALVRNGSGALGLLLLVALAYLGVTIWRIVWFCQVGDYTENRYGPVPQRGTK